MNIKNKIDFWLFNLQKICLFILFRLKQLVQEYVTFPFITQIKHNATEFLRRVPEMCY